MLAPHSKPRNSRSVRALRSPETLEARLAMAVFAVTSTNDSGAGSLREAILQANALVGSDRIEFNIASTSKTIALSTALPWLEDTTEVDGTTQPGYVDRPVVELDGSAIGTADPAGLTIASDNSSVRGLTINNFAHGLAILNASGAVVAGNHIGVDNAGGTAIGNRLTGIFIVDSSDNLIGGSNSQDRNVISGNAEQGLRISGNSTGNRIQGNYIGANADGLAAVPNKREGILIGNGASQTIIGTDGDGKDDLTEGNIIAGNLLAGVMLSGTNENKISGNRIGVGAGAHTPLANGSDGITLAFESSLNFVGTNRDGVSDDLEANVIASNHDNGIRINNSRANIIAGNFIGLLSDGVTGSPNVNAGVLIDGGSLGNKIGRMSTTDTIGENVISANGTYGVWIANSNDNSVNGNLIGNTADNSARLPNTLAAVRLTNAVNNEVGVTDRLSNSIGYGTKGILVDGVSHSNVFSNNRYAGSIDGIPIDLGGDGITVNDKDDKDSGANALQNFPTLELLSNRVVSGTLNSRPFQIYRIELYLVGSADGVAIEHNLLTSFSVNTDGQGNADWLVGLSGSFDIDQAVQAIAYEVSVGTSEFSSSIKLVNHRQLDLENSTVAENIGSLKGKVYRADTDAPGDVIVSLSSSDPLRATVPAQVVITADSDSAEFTINVLDDLAVHYDQLVISALAQAAGISRELRIMDNDSPWYNYGSPLDVNGDGSLSAIDALLIINELNSGRAGSLNDRDNDFPPAFVDVNNDNNVSSFDALLVINAINSGGNLSGEGENQFDAVDLFPVGRNKRSAVTAWAANRLNIAQEFDTHIR